jgi:2-dehydropantoate 2-reductase
MKLCIYGAGAIGGYLGVLAAEAGAEVSLIARGAHLAAIRERGLTLRIGGEEKTCRVEATDDPYELGPQDGVIITLKAPAVAGITETIQPLFGPETFVVTAQNGIPWWYFHKHGGHLEGRQLSSIDPDGELWRAIAPERCIGAVVYQAAEVVEPGVIAHSYGNRLMLGEPDGSRSERVAALSKLLTAGGLKAPVRPWIRDDIWLKLWGNLAFNPVSALTGGTLEEIAGDPDTRALVRRMMVEAQTVAEALGIRFALDVDARIKGAEQVGAHRTSMLQDLERGRTMEIDALVKVVAELGDLVDCDTPSLDLVLALIVQRARLAGCYPA